MVLIMKARRWVLVIITVVSLGAAVDYVFPQPPGCIRHRGLRYRVGCRLEEWGVIPRDPFRHVEG
jgi:hypothetical protein